LNEQFSFQEVVEVIKSGHRIDFLDENKKLIKFHSAFSLQQWQMGSVIYADAEMSVWCLLASLYWLVFGQRQS